MQRTTAIDFFGVIRAFGYSISLMGAIAAGLFWLASKLMPAFWLGAQAVAGWIAAGLLIAWASSLCRMLVRRMTFESPQH